MDNFFNILLHRQIIEYIVHVLVVVLYWFENVILQDVLKFQYDEAFPVRFVKAFSFLKPVIKKKVPVTPHFPTRTALDINFRNSITNAPQGSVHFYLNNS